ncbi:3-hydroxybutyryl-CoA dehydrogenase [Rhodococcus sp. WWJCD1]|uniref:3-hydroxybutyryl-CoA dehydrogenase n=1 Tax=Rhodococcus sp. WWJCD1 TaxID=2022519 RepID=UPI0020CD9543|nr:3-hydroxybutyryl-CoA dehydrogenase [Rhodococcus sp. WWJCD1]
METKVGVVGGGSMGAGIAEVVARAGDPVLILERDEIAVTAAAARINSSLLRAVHGGKLTQKACDDARSLITTTLSVDDFVDRELVIEALPEIEEMKSELFRRLDAVVSPTAVLASNTSSIPINRLANATAHPERVVGMHFFNPVPVMALVEIVVGLRTSESVASYVTNYVAERLSKDPIRSGDRAGFIVNTLLVPYLVSAIRMLESGFARAEDIDSGMVAGCGHPMGPLKLCDTVGLDVILAVTDSLYDEFRESQYVPPPLLRRMVEAGRLGRKTGRGFYTY